MSEASTAPVTMWPYIAAASFAKMALAIAAYLFFLATDQEVSNFSTAATLVAAAVGVGIFARQFDRPMVKSELLQFALGAALFDLAYSAAITLWPIVSVGAPITMQNIDLATGGNGKLTSEDAPYLLLLALIAEFSVFALSLVLAWIWTRRLPRKGREATLIRRS